VQNREIIGLFDSGVGGLSVLKQLETCAQRSGRPYHFVYLGDTARCPYGNREPEEITLFVSQIVEWLSSHEPSSIVMACNTSAALAKSAAESRATAPLFDLIGPTADYVADLGLKTGVLATASTIRSGAFRKAINARNADIDVVEIACPDLVPIVEQGLLDTPETLEVLRKYAKQLKAQQVKVVILGCTHYPFLATQLAQLLPETLLVDPAEQLAERVISPATSVAHSHVPTREVYVTGSPESFSRTASICLKQSMENVLSLSLSELERIEIGSSVSPVVSGSATEVFGSTSLIP
jgi:glutamate racemase